MTGIKTYLIFIILLVFQNLAFAIEGSVTGIVYDDATGETLPGVTILVTEVSKGTLSGADGKFTLKLPEGNYDIRISFVSYETIVVNDVIVREGETTIVEDLRLREEATALSEVVVTASRVTNTEVALMAMKRVTPILFDGISAANFKKIGDSDAAASVKRVPGVSVSGGKYVYVRGLGDRYSKTLLNEVDIPNLDPDRNTLQMDIFPNSIIDNIMVYKTFSPDLPADFTGGIINITLKELPDRKTGSISLSAGYNPEFHFNEDFLTYSGGKTDFLGYDDGSRNIPATTDVPLFTQARINPEGIDGLRYKQILQAFNPVMAASRENNLMDFSFGANLGNSYNFRKFTLGYIAALSYKSSSEYYENALSGRYIIERENGELAPAELQYGDYGVSGIIWSGLAGVTLKTGKTKHGINILHIQNGESTAGIFNFDNFDKGSVFSSYQHNLEYSQRSLTNLLLEGQYDLRDPKWFISWKVSPTLSGISDPDIRFTRYETGASSLKIGTETGFPERIWRELEELNLSGNLNVTKIFSPGSNDIALKFGGAYTFKEREFAITNYSLNIRNIPLTGNPDELFYAENLWPYNGNPDKGTTYEVPFIPVNPNQFVSNVQNTAGYVSIEFYLLRNLKTTLGVRAENFVQRYTGQDQQGINVLDNDIVISDFDLFPAVNIMYSLSATSNLRFSYAGTIARPSFKELSYAEISDPISGRVFIGGLFQDKDNMTGITYWNGNLVCTRINNFDLRWEKFYTDGQTISLSTFYKIFTDPIEIVQYASQAGTYQPRNVGHGEVIGAEIEFRQNFSFISAVMKGLSFSANITLAKSKIKIDQTELNSRIEYAIADGAIEPYRDMAGQAPYIINSGLTWNTSGGLRIQSFDAGIYYNVQGESLQYVGIADRPDIYSRPFHSLNFNSNVTLGKFQAGFKIDNLLRQNAESVFRTAGTPDKFFSKIYPGMSFTFRMSYSIF